MLSNLIDFDQSILNEYLEFCPQEDMLISEILDTDFPTTAFEEEAIDHKIFYKHISGKAMSGEEFEEDDPCYGYISNREFSEKDFDDKGNFYVKLEMIEGKEIPYEDLLTPTEEVTQAEINKAPEQHVSDVSLEESADNLRTEQTSITKDESDSETDAFGFNQLDFSKETVDILEAFTNEIKGSIRSTEFSKEWQNAKDSRKNAEDDRKINGRPHCIQRY